MQVVADPAVSISELLPQLVVPVVKRECDMALAKHADTVSIILAFYISFYCPSALIGLVFPPTL